MMAFHSLRKSLSFGLNIIKQNSILTTVPRKRYFGMLYSYKSDNFLARSFRNSASNFLCVERYPTSKKCECCGLHTQGDKAMAEVLKSELEHEKENTKSNVETVTSIRGFTTEFDGALVTLKKTNNNENISVNFSVNNSVSDDVAMEQNEDIKEQNIGSDMLSKPAFVVNISKDCGKTLSLRCVYTETDTVQHDEEEYDMIEISEVTILKKDGEWDENIYAVEGAMLDGVVYDHLLQILEERGIDSKFVNDLMHFSTTYEHKKYVEFLEDLHQFALAK